MRDDPADQDKRKEVDVPGFWGVVVAVISGEQAGDLIELIAIIIREIYNKYCK